MISIRVLALDPALSIPEYARPGDAAVDLISANDVELASGGGRGCISTGLALELPEGYCALVLPRSGLAANHGITCLNAPGLIDSGYRGEIQVVLVNTDPSSTYLVKRGDRIAQLMVQPVAQVHFVSVDELSPSARGEGGFGHSGR